MYDAKIIFLGAVQGITEFLPVSSSGHLAFFQMLFGYTDEKMLAYDIVLHLATLCATLLYFRKDVMTFSRQWAGGFTNRELRATEGWCYGWAVFAGTIATFIIAYPLKKFAVQALTSPVIVAMGLFFTSLLLWYMNSIKDSSRKVSIGGGIFVGLAQGIAAMPGISRSCSTIFSSRLAGLSAEDAFRFSFLLSIPAIAGATLLEVFEMFRVGEILLPAGWWLGALVAFVLGFLSLVLLRKFVVRGHWKIFSVYCSIVAFIMVLLSVLR